MENDQESVDRSRSGSAVLTPPATTASGGDGANANTHADNNANNNANSNANNNNNNNANSNANTNTRNSNHNTNGNGGTSERTILVQINHTPARVTVPQESEPLSHGFYTPVYVETFGANNGDVITSRHRVRRVSGASHTDAAEAAARTTSSSSANAAACATSATAISTGSGGGGGGGGAEHKAGGADKETSQSAKLTTAQSVCVNLSFAVNVLLVVIKLAAAIASGSIVVVASALDSALDILSGAIIFATSRAIARQALSHYPVGKTRLAPVGIIVFAAVMGTSTATVVLESIQTLAQGQGDALDLSAFVVAILVATVVLKFALFVLCRFYAAGNSGVLALAEDHRNDTLSNIVAVAAAVVAAEWPDDAWWVDGAGAIVMGVYIIAVWVYTGWEQVKMIAGHAAEPGDIQRILEVAANWHAQMTVDKIRAYHYGERYMAELEVVLPAEMTVRESHHIGLSLQQRIERFEEVERCFVHIDYKRRSHEEHFDPATGVHGTFEA